MIFLLWVASLAIAYWLGIITAYRLHNAAVARDPHRQTKWDNRP